MLIRLESDGSNASEGVKLWRESGVTGVCAFNDEAALMILSAVEEQGLSCPTDLAIVGYDAARFGAWTRSALTTISWRPGTAAESLTLGLLAALDDQDALTSVRSNLDTSMNFELIERSSA